MNHYTVTLKQKKSGWGTKFDFPKNLVAQDNAPDPAENGTVTFEWDATNNQVKASIKLTK